MAEVALPVASVAVRRSKKSVEVNGLKVAALRNAKLWAQPDLASAADVVVNTIKRIEPRESIGVHVATVRAIAAALDADPLEILADIDSSFAQSTIDAAIDALEASGKLSADDIARIRQQVKGDGVDKPGAGVEGVSVAGTIKPSSERTAANKEQTHSRKRPPEEPKGKGGK